MMHLYLYLYLYLHLYLYPHLLLNRVDRAPFALNRRVLARAQYIILAKVLFSRTPGFAISAPNSTLGAQFLGSMAAFLPLCPTTGPGSAFASATARMRPGFLK